MSDFEKELLESAAQAQAIAKGEMEPAAVYEPAMVNVTELRSKLGMSQTTFAHTFKLRVATVRDWEQGRRAPDQSARVLLNVIKHNPGAVLKALETEQEELARA